MEDVRKGGISVETEHIFPIIKKWLYSDKDIFLREIVSNACDAVTKLRRLSSLGQVELNDDYRITVKADKEAGTITVSDNGIGMTEEELDKYLCQIALSGALDFIKKYEGEDAAANGIIGHFGLGFYSSFMVSDTVTVETKSYTDAPAVRWVCGENGEYVMEPSHKTTRGTDVVMHVAAGEEEYLNDSRLRGILEQYCSFMPVEIYYEGAGPEAAATEEGKEPEAPKPVNDVTPLWTKNPSDCTEEEYLTFYQKVFHDYREPLFYIHINADYPLNFKGILYFPRITNEYESLEGQVKLYYNQVFVADNIKEVIPEFLLMLRGVVDCPELPLNVSRSYLQNSGYVSKMSQHIVKKVADKLNALFNTEREKYEALWPDIKIFAEYGCLRDKKFYDRVKGSLLYPLTNGKTVTLDEYLEAAKETHENTVYYATDKAAQAQYIAMLEAEGIELAYLDKGLDNQFISMVEQDRSIKFLRVDAGVADALKGDGEGYESQELVDLFQKVSGHDKLTVRFETLKDATLPAILTVSEEQRRFGEMMKLYGMGGDMPAPEGELVLNAGCDTIRRLAEKPDEAAAKYLYMLALIGQRQLTADELRDFLAASYEVLGKLV
ncbi:MAG: molecular chaperone HtpG [Ruminococcaceae bacterium]|nr:molecular chaperone HtpG [Oscillospiraceae bacterium]